VLTRPLDLRKSIQVEQGKRQGQQFVSKFPNGRRWYCWRLLSCLEMILWNVLGLGFGCAEEGATVCGMRHGMDE
jgi:hypothetical protein